MSKSKKNTIDPENIISNYGADSVRLFILSDSPPEKDVQWSEEGIIASFKFIQKLWSLNEKILEEINKNHSKDNSDEFTRFTNKLIKKINENLENFHYNIIVANLHEMYSFLNKEIIKGYKKETILENYKKILIIMMPILPHLSNECFDTIKIKSDQINWPKYDEKKIAEEAKVIVIQINGKKRGLINTKLDLKEDDVLDLVKKDQNMNKYLSDKEIRKKIYIKNKLMNIII
jgi:leucyl-tRNA synthetase